MSIPLSTYVRAITGVFVLSGLGALRLAAEDTAPPVDYYGAIKPLLAAHCYKCHDGEKEKSGLRLDVSERARAGGESGEPAIVPGASARSEMVRRINSHDPEEQMPPKGARLTAEEVSKVRRWIDEGAQWPARDEYWAFQSPQGSEIPRVSDGADVQNSVDGFILTKLEAAGTTPAPRADRRTLLRRAFADLIGMPPSPEEAAQFLSDEAPDAFAKLVDRLLADPRYGERWARHWLDLARYGESDGYEDDKVRPHAWRYRDYVIRAFNADKPYDRFVEEQIAGDELWPNDPEAWIATGFLRLGAWDGMSKDPPKQRQDFLNEATDAVGAVFLGVTLGCARCHDHKYDAIRQQDYYAMQAFFAGMTRETRPVSVAERDPARVREEWQRDSEALKERRSEHSELLRAFQDDLEQKEAEVEQRVEKFQPGRITKLKAEIKALEAEVRLREPQAEVVTAPESPAPKTLLLKGGELSRPGAEIAPAFIGAIAQGAAADPCEKAKGRRTTLARWLASPQNPLTARVIVNRLWQHHFGTGLVATASDFGRNGRAPTHPELLDWLAQELAHSGFSLKHMHRLMMNSAAYQRSSGPDPAALARDPENRLLWRMPRRRLEGEAIRDSILAVSGKLNPAMGGPGIYAALPQGVNVEFPNNDKELSWGKASEADGSRRSIYLFQRRSLTFPLMEVFDGAPMNQSCAGRAQTTVAPQALALFNGEFCRQAAAGMADRLRREAGRDAATQIDRAFRLAFTRPPTPAEQAEAEAFLREQRERRRADGAVALTDFCHAIFNANEFIYID